MSLPYAVWWELSKPFRERFKPLPISKRVQEMDYDIRDPAVMALIKEILNKGETYIDLGIGDPTLYNKFLAENDLKPSSLFDLSGSVV